MPLLEVQDLCIRFKTPRGFLHAVDHLSFTLESGRSLGIVGESGSGKSVTALSLLRLLPSAADIYSGKILLEGKDLLKLSLEEMREVRGGKIAMIFQDPMTSLNPVLPIGFQIEEAIVCHHPELSETQRKKGIIEVLEQVGIPDAKNRVDHYPHELSGGLRQRVMIAMALSCRPKILVADEPTTALDVTIQAQILKLIAGLQKELGMALILITHDLAVVSETVDEVMVMYAGQNVEKSTVKNLFKNPWHPYTKALIECRPSPKTVSRHFLNTIAGTVNPVLGSLDKDFVASQCRFHERCALVEPHCRQKDPILENFEGHDYRCFEVKPSNYGK